MKPIGIDDHPEPLDARLGGGQDVEVAEAEHPPEDRLGEDGVVDLLERAVRGALVDHALDLHDAPVGQHELGVEVAQRRPDEEGEPTEEEHGDQHAEEVPSQARWSRSRELRTRSNSAPMIAAIGIRAPQSRTSQCCLTAVGDPFTRGQQRIGVAHVARSPSSGPRMGPTVDVPDPLPGQMRVELCRGDTRMTEQLLDDPQVGAALEEMGGKRVAQGVRADPLGQAGAAPTHA